MKKAVSSSGREGKRHPVFVTALAVTAAFTLFSVSASSHAFPVPEGMYERQERARALEKEISALEAELFRASRDLIAISASMEEIQKEINNSYLQIEKAQAELDSARKRMNSKIRYMYMQGGVSDLTRILASSNVSDFIVSLDSLTRFTAAEARSFSELKRRKEEAENRQVELVRRKRAAAVLARGTDTAAIEALLSAKKQELARVTGELIAAEALPAAALLPGYNPSRVYSRPEENGFTRTGQVISGYSSWYGNEFHGRPTASGEVFDQYGFTCAHRTLPFGTWLRVSFRGRSTIVRVNDRGPFIQGRFLDLSRAAAESIGLTGVQWVDCEIVVPGAG